MAGESSTKRNVVYAVLLGASMLGGFAQTAINTALPSMSADLCFGLAAGQWLATSYLLCFCVVTPLFASLLRFFGVSRLFACANAVFVVGCFACYFGDSLIPLVIGRVLQGFGAALTVPLLQGYGLSKYPDECRGFVMGLSGLALSFAPNVGPTIAGALTTFFGWRSCFAFLGCFGLACCFAGMLCFRKVQFRGFGSWDIDARSVVASTIGCTGLLLGFSNAPTWGIVSPFVWAPIAIGIAGVVWFVRRQRTLAIPIIDLSVLRCRRFGAASVALGLLNASFIGLNLVIPLALQEVRGCSAFQSGLLLLPGVVATVVTSPIAGYLQDRVGTRIVAIFTSVLLLIGTVGLLPMCAVVDLRLVAGCQFIRCLGLAPYITTVNTWGLSALPDKLRPDGISLVGTIKQLCAALGTAVLISTVSMGSGVFDGTEVGDAGVTMSIGIAVVSCAMVFAVSVARVRDVEPK